MTEISEDNRSNPVYPFLDELPLTTEVRNSLRLHLNRIVEGSDQTLYTPLCKKTITSDEILERWDSIFKSNEYKMNSVLLELESANREKFGSRSKCKPWVDRKASLLEYFSGKSGYESFRFVNWSDFDIDSPRLRPISLESAITYLKNGTNSGLPFYTKKGKVKDRFASLYTSLKDMPCILFTRTQEGDKTRNVWGFPIKDTTTETMFYQPLLTYQKSKYWRAALISPEEIDKRVTKIISRCRKNSGYVMVSVDFSAFDASISPLLVRMAFGYIKSLFQDEFHQDIDNICERFLTIPILTPDGVLSGLHGVPSGSTFTNEVDSLVQYLIAKSTGKLIDKGYQIQGDDGVYLIEESSLQDFIDAFSSNGLKLNVSKCHFSKDYCVYLQCLHHPDYTLSDGTIGGVYPVYRALNRLVHQERWSSFEKYGLSGLDYYSLRAICILENCKHHPLFEELVRFILELDKTKLNFSQESLSKYCQLLKEGPGAGGHFANQYGSDAKGLSNFATVKLIKRLQALS